MQTVASLAERLEMSPEAAVERLRYMLFEVENVDSVISDEEIDILIDLDDDPSIAERVRAAKLKEQEKARKRTENAQKAAQKSAAKRKAAKTESPPPAETVETTPVEAPVETVAEILPPAEETAVAGPVETAAETEPVHVEPAGKPRAEILRPETVEPEPKLEAVMAPEAVETAAPPVSPEPATEKKAKKKEKEKDKEPVVDIRIGTAIDRAERTVEIVRADGTLVDVPDIVETTPLVDEPETAVDEDLSDVLAEAERRQEEEEKRKAKLAARPLAKPDPAVVAEVKRRAAERAARAQQARRVPEAGGTPSTRRSGDAPGTFRRSAEGGPTRGAASAGMLGGPVGGPGLQRGGPVKDAKSQRGGKKAKKGDRRRGEDEMRRDAAAVVKGYQAGGLFGGGPRKRKHRNRGREDDAHAATMEEHHEPETIEVEDNMTVEDLANLMGVSVSDVILDLMDHDVMATKNQALAYDLIRQLAEARGFIVKSVIPEESELLTEEPDDPADLVPRAPVITVMGHVDHGKTSLLDRVRAANVAEGEAGGITQHIAAYDVPIGKGRVVFLDTPGHEAFTQMRARGAKVTDIVVLVVAADDGVMPQTIEAIDHAKAAEVPIVVAINKIDKPDAQPDRIRQELTRFDLVDEQWGGKTIMRNLSAKTGAGVDELLEMLLLEAELLELKANPKKKARGTVIESEISRGQGPVAWVLVQGGTLRVGDAFLAGHSYGRVRSMHNSRGEAIQEAGPSTPVVVTGFNSLPDAGDIFMVTSDERIARAIAEQRSFISRQKQGQVSRRITLENFQEQMIAGERHELNVVFKADVQGSVDVLASSLAKIGNEEVRVKLVHSGVGGINESDVLLASASDAVIIGFHVTANAKVQKLAEQEGVDIRTYRVIYEAIEDIRKALEGMLTPETQEVVTGHAEIRAIFRSSAYGNIAGSYVQDGEIARGALARVVRDGVVVYTGRIASLRRNKEDARTVLTGFECGIKLDNFEDVKVGDIVETYRLQAVDRTLA